MHLDFKLALRRNTVEAATASASLHSHDAKTVSGIFADSLESGKGIIVDFLFKILCLGTNVFLLKSCLRYYFIEFLTFFHKYMLIVGKFFFSTNNFRSFLFLFCDGLADILFGEFYLKSFIFFLFFKESEFTVVSYIIDLLVVF